MAKKGMVILKWLVLAALFSYCIAMSIWAKGEADRHVCDSIEIDVKGNPVMDSIVRRGVIEELAHYPGKIVGARLNEINTGDVEKYLSGLSNFESVNCMISSGGRLRIEIVPLVPVMRVFYADNSYYINKDGKHIDSKAEFYADVPVVTGNFTRNFQPQALLPLVRFIEGDKMLNELVSMIEVKDANNLILVPRMLGHVVNFGDTSRLGQKKEALELFYKKVIPYKGWEEYDTISVKFKGQVVATRRIKPVAPPAPDDTEDIDPDEETLGDHIDQAAETAATPSNGNTTNGNTEE